MDYEKTPKTYEEQMEILRSRGCSIGEEAFCIEKLASINYYRFSAYFLPFKQADGQYLPGTSFERVYALYEFDRKFRNLLFGAIEVIEVNLRTKLAYYHAHKYGAIGYLCKDNFSSRHNVDKFKENLNREINSNKNVLFVQHHIEKYNGVFPIWVISELFTFGMLSYFYNDLLTQDQKAIATGCFHANYKAVGSWLRCCTDLRNICAHYGRLYYRIFSAIPAGFSLSEEQKRRLWGAMLVVKSLYPSAEAWQHEFVPQLQALFEEYEDAICLHHLAFPKNWIEQLYEQNRTHQ